MAQSQKRIGLIGLSAKGSWAAGSHLKALTNSHRYIIAALQNSSKASADAAASAYSLNVTTHDNPHSLATDPNVDIVAVSVNVPQHYSLAKPAIEAGKDVFVEFPLARNLQEAEELAKLAKEKGVRTMVGLQGRQSPAILKVKEFVQSGKLGKILGTQMYGHGSVFTTNFHSKLDYCLPIESGANLLTINVGHAIDALCWALGEVKELSATLANNQPEITIIDDAGKELRKTTKTAHDYVSLAGTLVNGGVLDVTFASGPSRTGRNFFWEINGTEGSLVLTSKDGMIMIFEPSVRFFDSKGNEEDIELEAPEVPSDFANAGFNVGRAWDAWAGYGLEKGTSVTTFEDAVLRHKMIDAIYRSAEKGTRESYL
ncbi:NAD(P)-binding protein [Lojkania enalia]|uniref:NAD(P)-binding protein n=1 Tax=Lojkania enalia TaxID=147567 RepID=A0A9P4JZQ0_9PLEO|nr:NAD(P)-binding protein [Didymosphaeria enalia]